MPSCFNSHTHYIGFFLLCPFQIRFMLLTFLLNKKFFSHENFITKNVYLTQFPVIMDHFSATDIFNTSIRDLPKPRLIQKRRNLLTLFNGDAFNPLSTWPQDIQLLLWKKPIEDTGTFKLMLFSWVMAVQSTR